MVRETNLVQRSKLWRQTIEPMLDGQKYVDSKRSKLDVVAVKVGNTIQINWLELVKQARASNKERYSWSRALKEEHYLLEVLAHEGAHCWVDKQVYDKVGKDWKYNRHMAQLVKSMEAISPIDRMSLVAATTIQDDFFTIGYLSGTWQPSGEGMKIGNQTFDQAQLMAAHEFGAHVVMLELLHKINPKGLDQQSLLAWQMREKVYQRFKETLQGLPSTKFLRDWIDTLVRDRAFKEPKVLNEPVQEVA